MLQTKPLKCYKLVAFSKKKCYTVPDGIYDGRWQDRLCWLRNEKGETFYRFDTDNKCPNSKGVNVKCKIESVKIKVYAKTNLSPATC